MPVTPTASLAIYLRDHEAAARAGVDLARRTASGQRQRSYTDVLQRLKREVGEDLASLRAVMRSLGIRPDPLLGLALQVGERVGRLKPNGSVLRRAPLSDLVEVEALLDAVQAKNAGWRALQVAGVDVPTAVADLAELIRRAERQAAQLRELHEEVARRVLGAPDGP